MSRATHPSPEARLAPRFAASGMRMTPQRAAVLGALEEQGRALTAGEVADELRRDHPTLGRATVFRTLDALVEAGMAQRFEREGHVYAYASCSGRHHHHLICTGCSRITEIDEAVVRSVVERLARHHGFTVAHETLDFYGTCRRCSARRRAPASASARAARPSSASSAALPTHG